MDFYIILCEVFITKEDFFFCLIGSSLNGEALIIDNLPGWYTG